MKKILAFLLAAATCVAALLPASCGEDRGSGYDPDNFIADAASEKIVKDKITVRMFVPKASIHGEWEDMKIFRWMEERTNIHVEFEEVSLAAYSEKRGLKWESRSDPADAFLTCNNKDEVTQSAALGVLAAFNDPSASDQYAGEYGSLIDNYMPNYKKWMEKYSEIGLYTEQNDGKIYSLCSINTVCGGLATQFINRKWLQKTDWYAENGRLPETVEELEIVLTEFSQKDMNGNGNKYDEVPLSYITSDQTSNFLMSCFGLVGTGVELDDREKIYDEKTGTFVDNPTYDKIIWVPATYAYRKYVETLNRWYTSGITDKNVYENTAGSLSQLGYSDRLGCFSSAGAYLVVGEDKAADYVAIGPLTSSISDKKVWYEYSYRFDPSLFVIDARSPYKRELARWMDVFYDEKNVAMQSYGEEGTDWVWDASDDGVKADGTPDTWHFIVPEGVERETYRATISYSAGLGGCALITEWNYRESTPVQAQVFADRAGYLDYLKPSVPSLVYTSEQMELIGIVETAMGAVTNAEPHFVCGDAAGCDVKNDSDWQAYIDKMTRAGNISIRGYEALVAQYQAAYDAYKEKIK